MTNYLEPLVGAHLILTRNNSVFMIRRSNTGFGDGLYSVPAGHVDHGEHVLDAAVREAKEEAGVGVLKHELQFVHVVSVRKITAEQRDRLQLFFVTETWEGEPTNMEPHRCDDARWFLFDELPENTVRYVREALLHYRKGVRYSELDE